MADEDDIESFWEGLRPPPKPFGERVREAVETGLYRFQEETRANPRVLSEGELTGGGEFEMTFTVTPSEGTIHQAPGAALAPWAGTYVGGGGAGSSGGSDLGGAGGGAAGGGGYLVTQQGGGGAGYENQASRGQSGATANGAVITEESANVRFEPVSGDPIPPDEDLDYVPGFEDSPVSMAQRGGWLRTPSSSNKPGLVRRNKAQPP